MTLSDTAIKNAKHNSDKHFRLADEKGMYLLVHKNGSKYFRLDYRFEGTRKTLALGVYPETSLKQARDQRDAARKQISDGIDPCDNRKAVKSSSALNGPNSFEVVAREWYVRYMTDKSDSHKKRSIALLQRDVFPVIGAKNIDAIKPAELLAVLRRIEDRGALETAHRALQTCGQVFRYGVATGRTEHDISPDLKGALPPAKPGHFSAITDPDKVAKLLRAIDAYEGTYSVKCALRIAPLVFVRPGELRAAEWDHIDLDKNEWRYMVTKTKTDHIVPLSKQVVEILTSLKPFTGNGRYVFPSAD